ncbi:MAG: PfkB family carbohydrate kinase [Bacteroidales bacterium]|jgi:fructokinase
MKKIYGIGETVFDIIFKNGVPQAGKAGGSMLNSMVSVGRAGLPACFISEYGKDSIGNLIDRFLSENGVDTSYVNRYSSGNTTLAIAFLDENNDASYTFYKNHQPGRAGTSWPVPERDSIILCGSFYSIWTGTHDRFCKLMKNARKEGAMVVYDPNFRKSHLSELPMLEPLIIENMGMADIVRGSDEDFKNIFGADNADDAYRIIMKYCPVLVYTSNDEGVYVRTTGFSGKFPVRKINPVSTIGAGDNFNAGMIASLFGNNIRPEDLARLGADRWAELISPAVDFATDVCMSYENYISLPFARRYRSASGDHI